MLELPCTADVVVPSEYEDRNGHMNIQYYLAIASEGVDEAIVQLGIPRDYQQTRKLGFFSAEHHLVYLSELHAGDRATFHLRLLERSGKTAHAVGYLLDRTRSRVSLAFEAVWLHVDMTDRRAAPWPDDVAQILDNRITADAALAWQPHLSGSIRLRG